MILIYIIYIATQLKYLDMKKIFALFFIFIVFASCDKPTTYQTIKIKKQYSVDLPSFLSEAENLNDEASLQYQNLLKEFYVLVIDEPKQAFANAIERQDINADLDGYSDVILKNLRASIQNGVFSEIENIKIGGLNARTFSVTGTVEGIEIYYEFAQIEGKKQFYQILIWTEPKRLDKHQTEMKKIINSFKELNDRSKK